MNLNEYAYFSAEKYHLSANNFYGKRLLKKIIDTIISESPKGRVTYQFETNIEFKDCSYFVLKRLHSHGLTAHNNTDEKLTVEIQFDVLNKEPSKKTIESLMTLTEIPETEQ